MEFGQLKGDLWSPGFLSPLKWDDPPSTNQKKVMDIENCVGPRSNQKNILDILG